VVAGRGRNPSEDLRRPSCQGLRHLAQRPLRRASQQHLEAVERWKAEDYPEIQKQARAQGGAIYFLDESAVRSDHHAGTTWAPMGETPVVASMGSRFSLNTLSAVSPRGELRSMVHEGAATAQTFCTFLERLAVGMGQKIFLIVDGHRIHRARKVKECLKRPDGKIELFFLPPIRAAAQCRRMGLEPGQGAHGSPERSDKIEVTEKILSALRSQQNCRKRPAASFGTPIFDMPWRLNPSLCFRNI